MQDYQVVQSVKMTHSRDMLPCMCIKAFDEKDNTPQMQGEEDLSFRQGQPYDYFYSPSNENSEDPQPYYGVRSYSSDYVAGTNGKIVESGTCSTRFLTEEEFNEHFRAI